MRKHILLLSMALSIIAITTRASQQLEGFHYGNATAPTGEEWQSPMLLGYNKLQPRAWFTSFATEEEARKVLPEHSSRWQSLNGTWKFHFAKNPDERPKEFYQTNFDCSTWDDITVPSNWNLVGLQQDGTQRYGTPIYVNQPVIFYHEVKEGDWKNGVMREPPHNWTTYTYRNEVGSYKRTFTIPTDWQGQEFFLEFDGVDSFFYLWVNGEYVGFSKNSRDAARFDITDHVHTGENQMAVEVYRNSDGSFLEAQDMFRLPGIFRTVSVYATPKVHIRDLRVESDKTGSWNAPTIHGILNISADIENLSTKNIKGYTIEYALYANKLYSDEGDIIIGQAQPTFLSFSIKKGSEQTTHYTFHAPQVKPWTAEEPNLYVLVAELKDKKGRVLEAVSTQVGFRSVEIKDVPASEDEYGLAGRYFLVNDKPLKLKGVNRHETNPATGHAITRQQMEEEVMMMKRANINHVRTSHYSCDPYFYYLCNKYGIWLEAEANLESHEYYYGAASLSHPKEWEAAHVARMMELAHSRINDPCIVIWSLGNEAGPGDNFKASYKAVKAFDPSRPVQYERNNNIVDMGSNQYPSVAWVRSAVKGNMGIKYPFHISEYAHSMGNAVGNLQDYWDAIESTNFFCGGAIWDWIDQSLYNYVGNPSDIIHQSSATGEAHPPSKSHHPTSKYLAYGGDFGDTPNDGQFVMNGIIFGDMKPKPQYYEVKKVYQNVGITWDDKSQGRIDIFNKNYYTDDLSMYDCRYTITADGKTTFKGKVDIGSVSPRTHQVITIPDIRRVHGLDDGKEYLIHIAFVLKEDMPWADKGYIQAEEQLPVYLIEDQNSRPQMNKVLPPQNAMGRLRVDTQTSSDNCLLGISNDTFRVFFDLQKGIIHSLEYGGKQMIVTGKGPRLDAFRAWVNNDNWAYNAWYENGLHNLRHKVLSHTTYQQNDGSVVLSMSIESQAPYGAVLKGGDRNFKELVENQDKPFSEKDFKFLSDVVYTIYPNGTIEMHSAITSNKPSLTLPRLGYEMVLPSSVDRLCYYGRGPIDNYPDRKTSQMIGIYYNKVADEFEPFPKPQDMGNHQDVRWCVLADGDGDGMVFQANNPMSISALPWSAQDLAMANHPYELPLSDGSHLHLDLGITGLGGNSCGQGGPLEGDRVKATPHSFSFMIRPFHISNVKMESINSDNTLSTQNLNVSTPELFALNGISPLLIDRDAEGNVSIQAENDDAEVYYTIGKSKKAIPYTSPFNLRDGGEVKAYQKATPKIVTTRSFAKIENIPIRVAFASSIESGEGDAEHLVDGNPNTYWHTMWSVTVANYPHWVDFDCGGVKTLKGFTYLPRQDSRNGNIKDFTIQVSNDGKTWGDIVYKGSFDNNQKEKRILFSQPVKARYLRFNALSSQDGQDFATGAEFSILEQ